MRVVLQKNTGSKNCIRFYTKGDSIEWANGDDFMMLHDLSHYSIEKTLGYTSAFFGLIESGTKIKDFEDKATRDKMVLTNEAWYAEGLANLILIEYTQGKFENFNEVFKSTLSKTNPTTPFLAISEMDLAKTRLLFTDLVNKWKSLPEKETMELTF
jgi:hypothetical protein